MPRLIGRRFDDHTVPLELLKDFAAFGEILVEVAKSEYLATNPNRSRTKGFTGSWLFAAIPAWIPGRG